MKGIDSLYGIDSSEELIPYEPIPFSFPSKEWEFTIPSFEEWVLLYSVPMHGSAKVGWANITTKLTLALLATQALLLSLFGQLNFLLPSSHSLSVPLLTNDHSN